MHELLGIYVMTLGGVGIALAFYIPHRDDFSFDRSLGTAIAGFVWLGLCFIVTLKLLSP